jgi:hypothetical protein
VRHVADATPGLHVLTESLRSVSWQRCLLTLTPTRIVRGRIVSDGKKTCMARRASPCGCWRTPRALDCSFQPCGDSFWIDSGTT